MGDNLGPKGLSPVRKVLPFTGRQYAVTGLGSFGKGAFGKGPIPDERHEGSWATHATLASHVP